MLLMIDNYDSFTYNLVRYFEELEHNVIVKRNDEITLTEIQTLKPSHLVISPGPSHPGNSGITLPALKAFAGKLPILGVCLGHQAIAASFGGNVIPAKTLMHGKTSLIQHTGHPLFQQIPSPIEVMRYHSLIVEPKTLPDCFKIIAQTLSDANAPAEIMAIAHKTLPIYGVQFHPESIKTQFGHQLLYNFLNLGLYY